MSVSCKPFVSLLGTHIYLNPHPFPTEHNRACTVHQLGGELRIQNIVTLLLIFLFEQQHLDNSDQHELLKIPEHHYPYYDGKTKVVNSASALFYAPSNASGIHGMRQEFIRSTPLWRNEGPQYDCAFVNVHPETDPMSGLEVMRILAFFSFYFRGIYYPCAVIHWFNRVGDEPDEDTGMWLVRPQFDGQHQRGISIIHIDSIYRAAHLIPVYGKHFVPSHFRPQDSYDSFCLFYVNRFADHHAFEITSP